MSLKVGKLIPFLGYKMMEFIHYIWKTIMTYYFSGHCWDTYVKVWDASKTLENEKLLAKHFGSSGLRGGLLSSSYFVPVRHWSHFGQVRRRKFWHWGGALLIRKGHRTRLFTDAILLGNPFSAKGNGRPHVLKGTWLDQVCGVSGDTRVPQDCRQLEVSHTSTFYVWAHVLPTYALHLFVIVHLN